MKTTKFFLMAALALTFAACSNDDNDIQTTPQPVKSDGIPFIATVSIDNGATTRALSESGTTLEASWAVGEKVALIHNGVSDEMEVESVSGGVATIKGTITGSPADGDAVTVIYPSTAADGTTGNVKADLLYAQDGTLATIASTYEARKGSGTLKVSGTASLSGNVSLANQFAIFKFTVKNSDASATIDVSPLTITIGSQDYVITPASATSTLYAALPAVSSQTVSFSATGSDSKTYTCSKDGVTFAAGKYYQSTLKMAAPRTLAEATAEDLGKIAGADGNIYDSKDAATTAGTTAVAMIAYVGSSTDHDTYTHGLAIALAEESNSNWSTAKSTCEGKSAVTNAAWLLPSQNQWKAMFKAFGNNDTSYSGLNSAIGTAGGTALQDGDEDDCWYWSSSEGDGGNAWYVKVYDGYADWDVVTKSLANRVRACLAF